MAYADYTYYSEFFGGTSVPSENFGYFSELASDIMDCVTFGRLKKQEYPLYDENIKKCCCALTETVFKTNNNTGGMIASEKIGDYSVSYSNAGNNSQIREIISVYLGNTGLLFRGADYEYR